MKEHRHCLRKYSKKENVKLNEYNTIINSLGENMLKMFYTMVLLVLLAFGITACVPREAPLHAQVSNAHRHDVNDVDLSDLDENMTESETMITEEGEESKMPRIEFPTSEYYALPRTGKGTVKGKIYVMDLYGSPVVGAGTRLYLNPITSYSKQWYEESYLGGARMQKADPRLFNYLRFTAANSDGNFAFYGVPNGSYYLIGTVKCAQQCGFGSEKSIRIATKVSVYGNQVVQKDLTRVVE